VKIAEESAQVAKESARIAQATLNDSSSMKTIAVMTLLFLPATFACVSQLLSCCEPELTMSVAVVLQHDILQLADGKRQDRVNISLGLLCSHSTSDCPSTCSMGFSHQEESKRISVAETQNYGTWS